MTEQINLFETAYKQKLRFQSVKGLLTTEDLWDLPLEQPDKGKQPVANLDEIAVELDGQLQSTSKSFVRAKSKDATLTELKLEIVKYIIRVKKAEEEEAKVATQNAAKKQQILELIHQKKSESLASMPVEELEKMLADL
jgi:hypothetical protein